MFLPNLAVHQADVSLRFTPAGDFVVGQQRLGER